MSYGQWEQLIDEERELREETEARMRALAAIVRWQRKQMKYAFEAILELCPCSATGPDGFEAWYHNDDADEFMNPTDRISDVDIERALEGIPDSEQESCETCRHYQTNTWKPSKGTHCMSTKATNRPTNPKASCRLHWAPKIEPEEL